MATPFTTPLKQRDLQSCFVFPGTLNSAGSAIVWGTGIDIASASGISSIDSFMITPQNTTGDFTPSDLRVTVNIIEKTGFTVNLSEIRSAVAYATGFAAGYASVIEAIIAGYDYVKIIAQTKAAGSSAAPVYVGCVGSVEPGQIAVIGPETGKKLASLSAVSIGYAPYIGAGPLPAAWS